MIPREKSLNLLGYLKNVDIVNFLGVTLIYNDLLSRL